MAANHELDGNDRTELDWLAFQYVAGELSADEAEQFESRLLCDFAAAEAVSRAVALGEAVSLALDVWTTNVDQETDRGVAPLQGRKIVSRPATGRIISVLTAACAIVAALLIAFRGDGLLRQRPEQVQLAALSDSTSENREAGRHAEIDSLLLETWTEARESIAALESDPLSDGISAEPLDARPEVTSDVPDWLFVAVELSYEDAVGNPQREVLEN